MRLHLLGFNTPGGAKPLGGFVFKIELWLEFWPFGAAIVQYCLQICVQNRALARILAIWCCKSGALFPNLCGFAQAAQGLGWGHVFIVKYGNGMV